MGRRLFIAGLAWRTTEEGLARHLASVGEVTWLRLMTDRETGRSKGFAFAEMADAAQAARAVHELHGEVLDERRLTVEEAKPRPDGRDDRVDRTARDRRPPRDARSARDDRPSGGAW
jgi:RNA recognition motif-containing protein